MHGAITHRCCSNTRAYFALLACEIKSKGNFFPFFVVRRSENWGPCKFQRQNLHADGLGHFTLITVLQFPQRARDIKRGFKRPALFIGTRIKELSRTGLPTCFFYCTRLPALPPLNYVTQSLPSRKSDGFARSFKKRIVSRVKGGGTEEKVKGRGESKGGKSVREGEKRWGEWI